MTDANILSAAGTDAPLGAGWCSDAGRRRGRERAGVGWGLDLLTCAEGIVRAPSRDGARLRVMTVEQGSTRRFALLAFGGAGAAARGRIADELGWTTILCPGASGVLSALGLPRRQPRASAQRKVLLGGTRFRRSAEDGPRGLANAAPDAWRCARREVSWWPGRSPTLALPRTGHEMTVREHARCHRAESGGFEARRERYGTATTRRDQVVTIRATGASRARRFAPTRRGERRLAAHVVFAGEQTTRDRAWRARPVGTRTTARRRELPERRSPPPGWGHRRRRRNDRDRAQAPA